MPTIGLAIALSVNSYISMLPFEAKRLIVIVLVINTFALPLLMIPLFYRFGIIKSIQMHESRERIIPMAFTLIPYFFTFYFLSKLPLPGSIAAFILGASIAIALAMFISIWWKVSIHMIGVGGLTGFIFSLSHLFYTDLTYFIVIAFIVSGIVAWARLALNAHKPSQIYAGFVIGFAVMLFTTFVL